MTLMSRALIVSIFAQIHQMTSWRHPETSYDVANEPAQVNPSKNLKITFFNLPILTFDLDLDFQTHKIYIIVQLLRQILGLYVQWFSLESTY